MPRDGSGVYHRPVGTDAVTDTTIESSKYNVFVADVEQDLNLPRPIIAGGTGATSADQALINLSAEKARQTVTNWDSTFWVAGSFFAATTAGGTAPVAGHAFAGIVYHSDTTPLVPPTNTNLVCEATDLTDPTSPSQYIRLMTAGVWGPWSITGGGSSAASSIGEFIFDSTITFPPASGQIRFNNATQNSTTEIFISHTTTSGIDVTSLIPFSIRSGYDLLIQDKDEPTKYKIFTATANPVPSGGEYRITVVSKGGGVDLVSGQRMLVGANVGRAARYALKNYIINGAMMVSQENGTTPVTANGSYAVDKFFTSFVMGGTLSSAQVVSTTPAGSLNRLRNTVTVADAAVATGDLVSIVQRIEGLRISDLLFGTAAAKTMTLQFGVRAPAGTYCVTVRNGAGTRTYIAEYVIAAGEANTDVVKSVTFAGDTTGTWPIDNTVGIQVWWSLMGGPTFQGSPNTWTGGSTVVTTNQFNFMGTIGNVFELFDVSLTEGIGAPPFQVPDYVTELQLCKRYFTRRTWGGSFVAALQCYSTTQFGGSLFKLSPEMRVAPTVTYSGLAGYRITNAFGGNIAAATLNFAATNDNVSLSTSTVASGLTAGDATMLIPLGGAWIQMDARP